MEERVPMGCEAKEKEILLYYAFNVVKRQPLASQTTNAQYY